MRGRFGPLGDRVIGITLGIVLGIAIILLFLFLGSRNAIDEPELSGGGATQTVTQPVAPPQRKPPQ